MVHVEAGSAPFSYSCTFPLYTPWPATVKVACLVIRISQHLGDFKSGHLTQSCLVNSKSKALQSNASIFNLEGLGEKRVSHPNSSS